jgi:hypothetical protein
MTRSNDFYALDVSWKFGDKTFDKARILGPEESAFYLNWTAKAPLEPAPYFEVVLQGLMTQIMIGYDNSTGTSMISYACDEDYLPAPPVTTIRLPTTHRSDLQNGEPTNQPEDAREAKSTPWRMVAPLLLVLARRRIR